MPLDISISNWNPFSKSISLQADGYYFFLYPLFEELAQKTGKMIDLYANTELEGHSLQSLKETLTKAKQLVEAQPKEWDVIIGWTDEKRTTPIHDQVNKDHFLYLLNDFIQLADTASEQGKKIRCVGD